MSEVGWILLGAIVVLWVVGALTGGWGGSVIAQIQHGLRGGYPGFGVFCCRNAIFRSASCRMRGVWCRFLRRSYGNPHGVTPPPR
jgi:hypothetical protein